MNITLFSVNILATMTFGVKQLISGGILAVIAALFVVVIWFFIQNVKDNREYKNAELPTLEELNLAPILSIDEGDEEGFDADIIQDLSDFENDDSEDLMKQINAASKQEKEAEEDSTKPRFGKLFKK